MISTKGNLQAARLGKVVTIVRDGDALNIPAEELPDLVILVQELLGIEPQAAPIAVEAAVAPAPLPVPTAPEPEALPRPVKKRKSKAQPEQPPEAADAWLAMLDPLELEPRGVGFAPLQASVKALGASAREATVLVRAAIAERVKTGELRVTATGRYALASMYPARKKGARKKKKYKNNILWTRVRTQLKAYPDGRSLAELAKSAQELKWTTDARPLKVIESLVKKHADVVSLGADGRVRLVTGKSAAAAPAVKPAPKPRKKRVAAPEGKKAAPAPVAVAARVAVAAPAAEAKKPSGATVRRRRAKARDEAESTASAQAPTAAPVAEPPVAEAPAAETKPADDGAPKAKAKSGFVASAHYTKRRRT